MESFDAILGCRLRWLRIERHLSRKTVADLLGIPLKLLVAQERGKRRIAPLDLVAYIHLYEVKLSSLFQDLPTGGNNRS
ncbi:MAG TPA: helix-turn-helix transcriptional regulator [Stellaceae bacterium]|nr:helix-turn-helix transcriptional regulator [Stellaceae bacterium]